MVAVEGLVVNRSNRTVVTKNEDDTLGQRHAECMSLLSFDSKNHLAIWDNCLTRSRG
jgi:hypothetical protein